MERQTIVIIYQNSNTIMYRYHTARSNTISPVKGFEKFEFSILNFSNDNRKKTDTSKISNIPTIYLRAFTQADGCSMMTLLQELPVTALIFFSL
jgi:hypothetical protein